MAYVLSAPELAYLSGAPNGVVGAIMEPMKFRYGYTQGGREAEPRYPMLLANQKSAKAGFTLPEILIAATLIAVFFISIFEVNGLCLRFISASKENVGATEAVHDRLEQLRNGRRVSTNDAYLEPARGRPNLEIRGDSLVDRVCLDDRRAVGVRMVSGEVLEAAEVVLGAGTIHTPAILHFLTSAPPLVACLSTCASRGCCSPMW